MKRWIRLALALIIAAALNLLGVILLTSLPAAVEDEPEAPEAPEEQTREAPEVRPAPTPTPRRSRPRRRPSAAVEETTADVAPSQLPTFSTLDAARSIPVKVDPAVQESLDTLFSDLSHRPEGEVVADALFEGSGAPGESAPATRREEPVREAAQIDEAPVIRRRVSARYPLEAERGGVTGYVVLRGLVERDGRISRVDVLESNPPDVFDEAARSAFAQWRFEPGRDNGEPVRVWVRKRLEFRLR